MAELTKFIALDCEMVGVRPAWWNEYYEEDFLFDLLFEEFYMDEDMVARVSLVNEHLECIMDTFVKPTKVVNDYRTRVSGVRKADLEHGADFKEVQKKVKDILKGRILVGHSVKHDLDSLGLKHPKGDIRDTSEYRPFIQMNRHRTPALRWLTKQLLGITIQDGEHSSVEDARALVLSQPTHVGMWRLGEPFVPAPDNCRGLASRRDRAIG